MFKWLNKQGVESDKGFVVQSTGRFTSEYREQSKKIEICYDHGKNPKTGRFILYVHSDNFEKWDDGTPINKWQQEEIKKNFIEAKEFQNLEVEIDDLPTVHYTVEDIERAVKYVQRKKFIRNDEEIS